VQYSVKNTFIEVKVAEEKPLRASSAPPAARFAQVPESPAASVDSQRFGPLDAETGPAHSDKHADEEVQRMRRKTISKMQDLTKKLNLKTSRWIRVVHSGYGGAKWYDSLRRSTVDWVAASKPAEGVYVHVPWMGTDGICEAIKHLNSAVRRDTYFRDMKHRNKSRLQFKEELLVTADGLVQEDASTSAGSESGSPGVSDLDAAEQLRHLVYSTSTTA
jgi:hypothetical protein